MIRRLACLALALIGLTFSASAATLDDGHGHAFVDESGINKTAPGIQIPKLGVETNEPSLKQEILDPQKKDEPPAKDGDLNAAPVNHQVRNRQRFIAPFFTRTLIHPYGLLSETFGPSQGYETGIYFLETEKDPDPGSLFFKLNAGLKYGRASLEDAHSHEILAGLNTVYLSGDGHIGQSTSKSRLMFSAFGGGDIGFHKMNMEQDTLQMYASNELKSLFVPNKWRFSWAYHLGAQITVFQYLSLSYQVGLQMVTTNWIAVFGPPITISEFTAQSQRFDITLPWESGLRFTFTQGISVNVNIPLP